MFPTFKFWGKDKSQLSIDYTGNGDVDSFLRFLKENTKYDWIEADV